MINFLNEVGSILILTTNNGVIPRIGETVMIMPKSEKYADEYKVVDVVHVYSEDMLDNVNVFTKKNIIK